MTSAYTEFQPDRPDGSFQNGSAVLAALRANGYALWSSIAFGMVPGFAMTVSGGTAEQPTTFTISNAAEGSPQGSQRWRGTVAWGADGNISTILWAVSQDGGANYVTVCTQTFSYDSNGNFTGVSGGAGVFSFFAYLLGRVKLQVTEIAAIQATINLLKGMAFQDASAVAITGGTAKNLVLGGTGTSEAQLAYLLAPIEKWVDLGTGSPTNTFTFDFRAGTSFKITVGNNFTWAVTNEPPNGWAEKVVVEVNGAAGFTLTLPSGYSWGGAGAPVWTAGPDIVTLYCRNHASSPVKRAMLSSYG